MPQRTNEHVSDARRLIHKHKAAGNGSSHAVHRAAEVEAWEVYRKSGDHHAAGVAITIAEMYHDPAAFAPVGAGG